MRLTGKRRQRRSGAPVVCITGRAEVIWPTEWMTATVQGRAAHPGPTRQDQITVAITLNVPTPPPFATGNISCPNAIGGFLVAQTNGSTVVYPIIVAPDATIIQFILTNGAGQVVTASYVRLPLAQ